MTGEANPQGVITLQAQKGRMPPIRQKWFIPLRPDRETPAVERPWTLDLAAAAIEALPWKGSNFTGKAYVTSIDAGLSAFSGDVAGGGRVDGTYRSVKQDNTCELSFTWKNIPVSYLIDQFEYPRVLTGTTSGQVNYAMDRDDPGTLKGQGGFEVHDGQFSADFIASQLQGRLEDKISTLPSSLKFLSLKTDLAFERDMVKTSNIQLVSEGIKVTGDGSFVIHGDMDYDLKVAISPKTADKIPALRENFNLQGLRLAQQDIELAFKVKGPTFNPRGELAESPPLGVTLVSSAFEVTSDAMKVIDIPRKILSDLLRIGGGIVGMK
jgi:hypothetical protein